MEPFWPRRSPHFLACRRAVRPLQGPAVIGLSGGPDSLALVAAAAAEGKDVRAVVVDHQLQPGSSFDTAATTIHDNSGLSELNRITPRLLSSVFAVAAAQEEGPDTCLLYTSDAADEYLR